MKRGQLNITAYTWALVTAFLFLSYSNLAVCQQKFSGIVLSEDSLPVVAATIAVRNSNRATMSGADGRFSISAKPGDVLIVSSVGMIKKSIKISNQSFVAITLSLDINSMKDVVIIGYGTARRKDVTGAVSKLTVDEFNRGIITNPLQQLQGKVPGVVIVQPGGDPNGEFTVRIRGATSLEGQPPLLVIDGVAIDDFQKAITTLNPSDVESFDILKDASAAAIYGARGANGVILVTTKKGRTGKITADYSGYAGMEKRVHWLDLLSGDEWRLATAGMNTGSLDASGNTDWQKQISQTAFSHSHSIGISGGTDQLNIRGSVGYIKQQGITINNGKEVITGRINVVQRSLKNKLEIRYGINTSTIKRDLLPEQKSLSESRFFGNPIFTTAEQYLPVWPVYNPDGSYYQPPTISINPVFVLKEFYFKLRENFFQGSLKADYELFNGMKLGVLGALSRANEVHDRFRPSPPGTNSLAEAEKANHNKQNFSGDIHGNYQRSFGKHAFDFTGVYEYNRYLNDGFGVLARGFLVPELLNNNLGTATSVQTNDIFSYKNEVKLISFLGRLVYNYDDRYIFTANFRRDGSSKFGANHRWGNFPSIALAWRVTNESFLKENTWLDNLKVRISYGLTGNQENLPTDSYQLLYGPAGPYLYNGQFYQSYAVTQENNPELKWEVRKSFNVGIDFSVFENRLNGTIDVFNDHTDDMLFLYDIPQPPFLTNKVYANAASAVNKGIEVSLDAVVIKNKNFTWQVQPNIATIKNHITKLLGQFKGVNLSLNDPNYGYAFGGGFGATAVTRLSPGHPAGVFWIPQHAGIDAAGHELYNNYDADGKFIGTSTNFTDQDKVFIDPTPKFTWGITNKFSYSNFDLDFLLRGVQGQKIFANSILGLESIQYLPGSNVVKKALTNGLADLPQASSYWLQNGSYARLENISLGYTFKKLKGISSLRFYLTATNVFVITKYEGVDPEIRTEGFERYIDNWNYPKSRGFITGVSVEF
jgi:iron complex outermembrane receptor protein